MPCCEILRINEREAILDDVQMQTSSKDATTSGDAKRNGHFSNDDYELSGHRENPQIWEDQ